MVGKKRGVLLKKYAVVSSEAFMPQIKIAQKSFPDVHFEEYYYKLPTDALDVVESISKVDGILFAGPLPERIAKSKLVNLKIPYTHIPSDEYTLTHTLLYLAINQPDALNSLSIDIQSGQFIQQVCSEMNIDPTEWYILDAQEEFIKEEFSMDLDEVVKFHEDLFIAGETKYAITNIDYVYSRLLEKKIPCSFLVVPQKAIIDAILQLQHMSDLAVSKKSEIAIGFISFHKNQYQKMDFSHVNYDSSIIMQQLLLDFIKHSEMTMRLVGMDQFVIYGTHGSVNYLLSEENIQRFFNKLVSVGEFTVSIGFGYGVTALEAEEHARISLYYAENDKNRNQVYITTSEKKVIGPIEAQKELLLKSANQEVLELAGLLQVSIPTISKLKQFSQIYKTSDFNVNQFADYFEVSQRTAQRMVQNLLKNEIIYKIGEEQPYKQGRPRAVYKFGQKRIDF